MANSFCVDKYVQNHPTLEYASTQKSQPQRGDIGPLGLGIFHGFTVPDFRFRYICPPTAPLFAHLSQAKNKARSALSAKSKFFAKPS
jgi:hypothetical protein